MKLSSHIFNNPLSLCFLFLLSLFPIGNSGSLYELSILPLIFLYSCFSIVANKFKSIFCLPVIFTVFGFAFAFVNSPEFNSMGPIFVTVLRIYSLLFFLSLLSNREPFDYFRSIRLSKFYHLTPYFVFTIVSLSLYKSFGSSYFNGIDYPFYTQESVNRQLFGPSLMLTAIYLISLSYILFTSRVQKSNLLYKTIVFIIGFSSLIVSLFSGSRFPFVLLFLALLTLFGYICSSPTLLGHIISFFKSLLRIKNFALFSFFLAIISLYIAPSLVNLIASIQNSDRIFSRIFALQNILFDPASDPSRGSKFISNVEFIKNSFSNLLGSSSPSFHLDSALITFGSYFGIVFLLAFISYLLFLSLKNPILSIFTFSTIVLVFSGGLVFLTPRYYLLPFAVISLINHLPFSLHNHKFKQS